MIQSAKTTHGKKYNAAGTVGRKLCEEHVKDPIVALDTALKCVENPYQG